MECVKIIVKGLVQGVGYRFFVKQTAMSLNVKGFVKNLDNGDVLIIAKGEHQDLKSFINACKRGPRFAVVKNLVVNPCKSFEFERIKNFETFKVLF